MRFLILILSLVFTCSAFASRPRMCARDGEPLYVLREDDSGTSDDDILTSTPFCNRAMSAFLMQRLLSPAKAIETAHRIFALTPKNAAKATPSLQISAACFLAENGDTKWARTLSKERGLGALLAQCMAKGGDFSAAASRLLLLNEGSLSHSQCLSRDDAAFFHPSSGVRRTFVGVLKLHLLSPQCSERTLDLMITMRNDQALVEEIEKFTKTKLADLNPTVLYLVQTMFPLVREPHQLMEPVAKCAAEGSSICLSLLKRVSYLAHDKITPVMPALWQDGEGSFWPNSDGNRLESLLVEPLDNYWEIEVKVLSHEDRRRLIRRLLDLEAGIEKIEKIHEMGLMPLDQDLKNLVSEKLGLKGSIAKKDPFQKLAAEANAAALKRFLTSRTMDRFPWTTFVVLKGVMAKCKSEPSELSSRPGLTQVGLVNEKMVIVLNNCLD